MRQSSCRKDSLPAKDWFQMTEWLVHDVTDIEKAIALASEHKANHLKLPTPCKCPVIRNGPNVAAPYGHSVVVTV